MAVQHEGERVLKALQPADRVVLLDERGRWVAAGGECSEHPHVALGCAAWALLLLPCWGQHPLLPCLQGPFQRGHGAAAGTGGPRLVGRVVGLLRRRPRPSLIAGWVQASDQSWPSLVFVLGGPFGHAPAVRQRGDDTIRLSRMVLNHQVANVVLLEQLYRAHTILRGEPYHH